ncbi:MAG TPA: hypothetical protein GXZ22_05045 [Clostridiaceae bacterium]|jgi:hypothetical protein|nr:hypothetical protein [Clostridiaceae bacterium]
MWNRFKCFLKSEKGINTVEIVILLAIMVGLAIIFREQIGKFANGIMRSLFEDTNVDWSPEGMKSVTGN